MKHLKTISLVNVSGIKIPINITGRVKLDGG